MAECVLFEKAEEDVEEREVGERRVQLFKQLSKQVSLEDGDPVSTELDFLQNVYFDELEVKEIRYTTDDSLIRILDCVFIMIAVG